MSVFHFRQKCFVPCEQQPADLWIIKTRLKEHQINSSQMNFHVILVRWQMNLIMDWVFVCLYRECEGGVQQLSSVNLCLFGEYDDVFVRRRTSSSSSSVRSWSLMACVCVISRVCAEFLCGYGIEWPTFRAFNQHTSAGFTVLRQRCCIKHHRTCKITHTSSLFSLTYITSLEK